MAEQNELLQQSESVLEILPASPEPGDTLQEDLEMTAETSGTLSALGSLEKSINAVAGNAIVQPEVNTLMAEARQQIAHLEQSAKTSLLFLRAARCPVYFPEKRDVEEVLLPVPKVAEAKGNSQWRHAAFGAAKRGETAVIKDGIPENPAVLIEQPASEFNPQKQFDGLRAELQTIIRDSAAVKKFVNSYTPQALRFCLSSFQQGEPFSRQFSGVISELSKSIPKEGAIEEVKTDVDLAKIEFRVLSKEVKQILEQVFSFEKCFGTTDQAVALQRNAEMSTLKSQIGKFDAVSGLVFELTSMLFRQKSFGVETKAKAERPVSSDLPITAQPIKTALPLEKGLRSEIEINQPQEWLDQEREAAFLKVREFFRAFEKTGASAMREWFAAFFSVAAAENGGGITATDLQSLVLAEVKSESASQVAGRDIVRPIFLFEDRSEFARFAQKVGLSGDTSGMHIPGTAFPPKSLFYKTGLVISPGEEATIDHEIRHSIDPNGGQRQGLDGAMNEAFAYYTDLISKNLGKKQEDGMWWVFEATLTAPSYAKHYFNELPSEEWTANWKEQINKMVTAIRMLTQKKGMVETQRLLAKTKTIKELVAIGEMV